MTTLSLHPRPTYRAIAKEQLCSVGLALRKEGIFFLAFLAIVAILSLVSVLHSTPHAVHESANGCASMSGGHDDGPMDLLTMALIPIGAVAFVLPFGLAGFIVPFGVWRSDDLARRSYHWAMPTVRGSHTLIKMISGWLWLMLALVVYLGFAAGLVAILTHIAGPSCFPSFGRSLEWINPFSGTTLVYLFTSIAVIGSAHPWRWIGGIPVIYTISISLFAGLGQHDLAHSMASVVTGRYGLLQAMFGGVPHGSISRWLTALALWGAVSCLGVVLVAYKRSRTNEG